ncbi:MAG: Coq4 family protein [Bacteroidota bacterium]
MKKQLLKMRSLVLVFLTHQVALPLLKIFRRPNTFTYTKEQLMHFPEDSLGKDLYQFLEKRKLPLLKHYARHDLKHVLLNYDTTDEGEACLQSFMLGNGRISFPVLATVLYGFVTMPEHWQQMRKAFKQGKQSSSIQGWKWNEILSEQTNGLRRKIFNHT